jgi:hypothetical protein
VLTLVARAAPASRRAGKVIKGWDIGVATMLKGEKCLLTCKCVAGAARALRPPRAQRATEAPSSAADARRAPARQRSRPLARRVHARRTARRASRAIHAQPAAPGATPLPYAAPQTFLPLTSSVSLRPPHDRPEYAYGDAGAGDKIPAGATLQFEARAQPRTHNTRARDTHHAPCNNTPSGT